MIITYQGGQSFRVSQGDLSLAFNPDSQRFKADVSVFSVGHPSYDQEAFVIAGPGEYEIKDITIKGFLSETSYQGSKVNTIYVMNFEGMNLCFLGALSNAAIPTKTLESLENIDILFVPISGEGVLDAAAAYKLAVSLEPSIIIPMLYDPSTSSGQAALKQFLKEGGADKPETLDKLVLKKKDLDGKEGDIIILKEE
jgi:L-ascorbate metabolism protein UlaG (beta-lactamase superfamily)